MRMTPKHSKLLKFLALAFCILPPAAATLYYFPMWYRESNFEIVVPAMAVFGFCICAIPLLKWIRAKLKSPAIWMLWSVGYAIFSLLEKIVDQMVVITFVGAVSNIFGAILWWIYERGGKK